MTPKEFRSLMPGNKTTRQSILQQMQDSEGAARQLIIGMSEEQGNWQTVADHSWSIWQCIEHLNLTNLVYGNALAEGLARAGANKRIATGQEIKPGWFARWFVSKVEPPVGLGVKTKPSATPAAKGDLEQAVARFAESHDALREIVKSWDVVDLNRVRYPNPFIPLVRFRVGTGLLIANAHDRRHLWQAQRVKEAPGYPKA
jgi:hypothetical protein